MKTTLPKLLVVALLTTGASAQLRFDSNVSGPKPLAPLSVISITVNPVAASQWSSMESGFNSWTAESTTSRPTTAAAVSAPFMASDAGPSSAFTPMAYAPPVFVFWKEDISWAMATRSENFAPLGSITRQDISNDYGFRWTQHSSSDYTAIARLQPYHNVTVVPEATTLLGGGVLLVFVALHFLLQRRRRRAR
ncbi:MAG: hypothetical protein JJU00_13115 [Opitutales bacterium]|nr:hypothetical protein [Opitutales bacterium]